MVSAIVPNTAGAVFLVTGANRGLGLEHVRQFLRKSQVQVVATARHPAKATHLKGLLDQYKERLAVVELDTGDEASIEVGQRLTRSSLTC